MDSISIVIPAYNEEASIKQVLEEALEVLDSLADEYEIIVCDDGSEDKTIQEVTAYITQKPDVVKLIKNDSNQGTGAALFKLYQEASKDWIYFTPADGQVKPRELIKLYKAKDNHDLIIGFRKHRKDSFIRKVLAKIYNFVVRILFNLPTHDIDSVKLYRAKMMQNLDICSRSAFIEVEIAVRAQIAKYRLTEIEVDHYPRMAGRATGADFKVALNAILDLLKFKLVIGSDKVKVKVK